MVTFESLEVRRLMSTSLLANLGGFSATESVDVGQVTYFTSTGSDGLELWKTDGSAAGTELVKALHVGSEDHHLYAVGGRALMFDYEQGRLVLWASDGTEAGTGELVTFPEISIPPATVAGDKLVFAMHGGASDPVVRLWASDGTVEGTKAIQDLYHGDFPFYVNSMVTSHGRAVFTTIDEELWSSDGTTAGTRVICNDSTLPNGLAFHFDTSSLQQLTEDGDVYFVCNADHVGELWKTDGTAAGTASIKSLGENAQNLRASKIGLFLVGWTSTPHLWHSDGTAQGTVQIGSLPSELLYAEMTANKFVFSTYTETGYGRRIYVSDGTAAGTKLLVSLGEQEGWRMGSPVSVGGVIYFAADAAFNTTGAELWQCDGTTAGTHMIKKFTREANDVGSIWDIGLAVANGKLVVSPGSSPTLLIDPSEPDVLRQPHQAYTTLTDGVLRIFGTPEDDNIRIYRRQDDHSRLVVKINGIKRSFSIRGLSRIHIYGYSGNDNIAVDERFGRITVRSHIWGGGGDDAIYTGSACDTVLGDSGDDVVNSGRSADEVMGGTGDDNIYGGLGDDTVSGEEGADTVNGAGGADMVGGGDDDSTDHLDGGGGADVIFGHAVYEIFYAGQPGSDPSGLDEILLN